MRLRHVLTVLIFLLAAVPALAQEFPPPPESAIPIDEPPSDQLGAPPADSAAAPPAGEQPPAAPQHSITDEAQRIWDKFGDAIYQVQVIDDNTGNKNSIGSGFQFSKDGLMATNYHVVSGALQGKEKVRLEYLHDRGDKGPLKILIVDVVHDLAILQMDKPGKSHVELGTSNLPKGTRLFSLGNPHDIGFTITEGTFNGINKESFIDKIHFSGALNPGMSGGPALGHDGKVVGINVATAGNSISFLVPVEPLAELLQAKEALKPDYNFVDNANKHVEEQLLKAQQKVSSTLLAEANWASIPFGPFNVPGRLNPALKCWGNTQQEEKQPYKEYFRADCQTEDRLFLNSNFYTGTLQYTFESIRASDKLNPSRFYSYYQQRFSSPPFGYGGAQEEDVSNYDCNSKFVDIENRRWKAAFCVRQYKKFPQVYDMQMSMALIDNPMHGMIVSLNAQGFSRDNALKLSARFLKEIHARDASPSASAPPPPSPVKAQPASGTKPQPDSKAGAAP